MKSRPVLTRSVATLLAALAFKAGVHAQTNGTWNVDANGNWSAAASWSGSNIANGADATASFRFNITGTRTITLDTAARTIGSLIFEDATTASNDWVLSSSAASNVLTLDVSTGMAGISVLNRTATINTVLAGTDGINVMGNATGTSGTLVLTAANTFTGGLTISGAITQLNNALAAGTNTITVAASSNKTTANKLAINGGVTIANNIVIEAGASPLAGNGAVQQVGTGQSTVNGTITITDGTANGGHFVGGTAVGNELVLAGPITATSTTPTIAGVVQRDGRVIYKGGGTGYSLLTVTNTALVGATNGISTAATITLGGSGNATLDLNGFDQALTGLNFGNTSNAAISTVNLGARTLSLNGDITSVSGGGVNVTHVINAAPGGAIDVGSTVHTINLPETLAFDDLAINGATIRGTGGISKIGAGAMFLSGVTIEGPLMVDDGTLSTVKTGQPNSVVASSLAFGPGVTALRMKIGANNDLITAGALTNSGSTTINLFQDGGLVPNGTYDLIKYSGTSPGLTGFTLGSFGHANATLVDTGKSIAVKVTGNSKVIWDGGNGTFWDTFTSSWKLQSNSSVTNYIEGDDVVFADNPASNAIDLFTNVTPSQVTFTNTTATAYTLAGSGGIYGPTGINKTGNGIVTLRTQNAYTGPTLVNAGTLELDHDATGNAVLTGTSGVTLAAGATLLLSRDDGDFTFNRNISGAGTVVIDPHSFGSGAARSVTISVTNTGFTGLWKLSPTTGPATAGGSFRVQSATQNNLGSGTVDVDSGAQLWISGTVNNNITISGAGYAETAGGTPAAATGLAYGGIGAIRMDSGTLSGNITLDGNAKIGAHNSTGTISGVISATNPTDMLILGGGTANHTLVLTGNNTYAGPTWVNSGGTTGTSLVQIGNNGTTGKLGGGSVTLYQDAMGAQIRFSRGDGYTLASGQNIISQHNGTATNLSKGAVFVNTTGTGLTINDNTIDLSDGTNGGNIHVAGNSGANGVNGATLNINGAASLVDVANFYVGDQANFAGIVNQSNGTVNVINQVRIGHYPTETSNYNISGGSFNITAAAPGAFPFATTGTTEQNGGIYVGVDGTGNLTQSGGTVSTNFIVLDNRGDTGAAANTPTGIDTYTLSGGTLVLKNAYGIISRNATTAVKLNGGTIQAATGISPNLDSNKITVGGPVTVDTNGANTFTLYGPLAGTDTVSLIGGGIFRTQDGTGTTATQAGGTMPGGSLGTASMNIGATNTLQANRTGIDIWSGALSGSGVFVKQNTGSLFLTGNGSGFTGTTIVSGGRLDLPASYASPAVTVMDGTALGGEPTIASLTLGSTSGSTVFFNPTTAGALTATNLTANGVTAFDFAAAPSASGPFTALKYTNKTGTGTFALANAANYRSATVTDSGTGTVTIDVTTKNLTWTGATNGTWDINNGTNWSDGVGTEKFYAGDKVTFGDGPTNVAVTVTSGVSPWKTTVNSETANYTFTSTSNGISGPGSLEKSGASTLTLSGPNTYSGPTIINGGTISIASASSLGNSTPTNTIAFNGGKLVASAALDLGAARAISVGAGGGTISASGTAALTITASGPISGAGTLTFTSGATAAPTYNLSGDNSGFTGTLNVDSTGATSGGTTLRFNNSVAPASGTINLAAGTVSGAATALDLANVTVGSGVRLVMNTGTSGTSSLRSQLSGSGTWNGPISLNGDNIAQVSAAGLLTLNGNASAGDNGFTGTFFLRGGGQGVVNGTINIPNGTVAKTDASTWTINSTGNNWANTSVAVGTLRMGAANVIPATANLNLGQNDTNTATLDLNGFNQTVASLTSNPATGTNANSKSITSATPATLTINQASTTTYGSIVSGSVALVKDGSGTLTLAGANTFTGNVTVLGGTLVAGGSTVTGLGSATAAGRTVTVSNGSTLSFTTNNVFGNGVNNNNLPSLTLNDSVLTSTRYNVLGNIALNGSTLTQSATDSGNYEGFQFRGNVTVGGTVASNITTGNAKANHLNANTTFDVADVTGSSASDLVVSTPLRNQSADFGSATGGLTKIGAGTMELTELNTYTGATTISAGTLLVNGSISGSTTTVSGTGILGGIGTLGPVNVTDGTVAPGNGIGTLSTGPFSLSSSSKLKFELAQPSMVGAGINDLISVVGDLLLDGTLQVSESSGFAIGTYRLFDYTGTLTNSGLDLDTAFLTAHPGSRIDTATSGQVNLVVVPEPGAYMSLLGGVGMLLGFQRARRRKS